MVVFVRSVLMIEMNFNKLKSIIIVVNMYIKDVIKF